MRAIQKLLLAASPVLLSAHSFGPPPRVTGAPGDASAACTQCHVGTALNGGAGKVEIVLPSGPTYTPGVKQHIQVKVSDPAQRRWGFEFSARLNSNPANGQAGDLASTDSFTQAFCDNGNPKPCPAASPVQFISHSLDGTRNGTAGGATFEFDWTPPADGSGPVTLYAAGNAANGDGAPTGDHIYTTNVQLVPAASAAPLISANGVVNAASFQTTIAPNSWITIFGANLATSSRLWRGDEIVNGALPASLDGVSVTINGKAASVEFISPSQINVLSPDDASSGPVQVQVSNAAGKSSAFTVQLQPLTPAFFLADGKHLAAPAAKPGTQIVIYGTGFGPTDPVAPAGQVVAQVGNLPGSLKITIGGLPAQIAFAGLIPGFAGLYQFNLVVPAAASDGDQAVVAQIGAATSRSDSACCFLTIAH